MYPETYIIDAKGRVLKKIVEPQDWPGNPARFSDWTDPAARKVHRLPVVKYRRSRLRRSAYNAWNGKAASSKPLSSIRATPAFKMEIRESKIHRLGVYALENIPAAPQSDRVHRREDQPAARPSAAATVPSPTSSPSTTTGPSTAPSAAAAPRSSTTAATRTFGAIIFKGHILYMSERQIRKGEELTVDYRFSDKFEKVKCKCGSKTCRGIIN